MSGKREVRTDADGAIEEAAGNEAEAREETQARSETQTGGGAETAAARGGSGRAKLPDRAHGAPDGTAEAREQTAEESPAYAPEEDRIPSGLLRSRPVEEAQNGSMVQDLRDMKRLGEEMERVKTAPELREDGLVPDPAQ